MTWEDIAGRWPQATGQAKSEWIKLTEDDLREVAGNRTFLVDKVQARYGIARDEAQAQVSEWASKFKAAGPGRKTDTKAPAKARLNADKAAAAPSHAAETGTTGASSSVEHGASTSGKSTPRADLHSVAIEAKDMATVGKNEPRHAA